MKADCISARVHEFFLVEKVSCGIKSHVAETYEIVSHMFTRPRSKKKWASVADRFKNYLRSF